MAFHFCQNEMMVSQNLQMQNKKQVEKQRVYVFSFVW